MAGYQFDCGICSNRLDTFPMERDRNLLYRCSHPAGHGHHRLDIDRRETYLGISGRRSVRDFWGVRRRAIHPAFHDQTRAGSEKSVIGFPRDFIGKI